MSLFDKLKQLQEDNVRLTKENKKLKEDLEKFSESYKRYRDFSKQELADSLYDSEEHNKKLESDLGTVIDERDNAFKKIKQLEERLDNKEKVNKSLREENRKLKEEIERLKS